MSSASEASTLKLFGIDLEQLWTGPNIRLMLAAAAMGYVTLSLWQRVSLISMVPPLLFVAVSLVALALTFRRVPTLAWLWWLLGAASLLWSLTPGNSLVAVLWAIIYLAAMVLGHWRFGFIVVNLALLYTNLEKALALNYFGLEKYVSGSVHYVMGAQALILVPLAFAAAVREKRPWVAAGAFLVLVVASYGALISGARAVYVPLLVLAIVLPVRSLVAGVRPLRVLTVLVLLAGGLWGLDTVIPKGGAPSDIAAGAAANPGGSPLGNALSTKASVEAQAAGLSNYGGIRNRVRLWHQGAAIGLANPLGAGAGSFPTVVHSYQRYPMAWSNSAHNIFVETFAELGWLGFLLLALLVGVPLVRVWLTPRWPIALSLFAIWFTLMVDVTSSHAYLMALAFATLGATYAARPAASERRATLLERRAALAAPAVAGIAVVAIALWWYLPCNADDCATARYLGYPEAVVTALEAAPAEDRAPLLLRARELYPQSLWVLQLQRSVAATPQQRLALSQEIVERFPYQHPNNYLALANISLEIGDAEGARTALERGLEIFPPDRLPFSEFRLTPAQYRSNWVDPATALLSDLQ